MEFDPVAAGEKAKKVRKLRKGKNYTPRKSKLEPFRNEIAQMFKAGYSLEVIQLHLETEHHCKVHRSTILRYIHSIGVTRHG
jgi:IS30 family transposase